MIYGHVPSVPNMTWKQLVHQNIEPMLPTSRHVNVMAVFFTFLWSQILELVTRCVRARIYGHVTSVTNMGRERVIHQNVVPMWHTSWHININASTFTFFVILDLMAFSLFPRKTHFYRFF